MAVYDPDANVTLEPGYTEEEWYRIGMVAQARLKALRQSTIEIPESLVNVVRVRRADDEVFVVRVRRREDALAVTGTVH